jgi:hypothetical protein
VESLLGNTVGVFIGTTCVIGFAAFMTGQALANTWKPAWQAIIYSALLGFADRFLGFALFEGELLSVSGYIADALVLVAISLFAYRVTKARKMVCQYPWLFERSGLFTWRAKGGAD